MPRALSALAAGTIVAGLLTVTSGPAEAGAGCVTIREARTVLEDGRQDRREIERGFDDVGFTADRRGDTLWREYTPCVRPGHRDTFVTVIYTRNKAGNWKSFYWIWALMQPAGFRTQEGSWSDSRG